MAATPAAATASGGAPATAWTPLSAEEQAAIREEIAEVLADVLLAEFVASRK
jgi:hypothetical protein